MQLKFLLKLYYKKIFFWCFLALIIGIAINYGIDKKIIVLSAFIISVFTEAFVGVSVFIAAIPIIGPMIIKIITIPIFWVFNAMGTLISGIAIKKGYATDLAKGRILTVALLIGIIVGYIIGNLIPL
tara:strand:- start:474 stop:854 length:381 start_codon:yes stop_codon:yes gene_type:complete